MRLFTLIFLCGILLLNCFHFIPSFTVAITIILFACIIFIFMRHLFFKSVAAFMLGFGYVVVYANFIWVLPHNLEGKNILITGNIASIPQKSNFSDTFIFKLKKINGAKQNGLMKLSWHQTTTILHPGEEWQLMVRLKRIHGLRNQGGFDYEAWSFHKRLGAAGYVVNNKQNKLLRNAYTQSFLNRLRFWIKNRIEKNLPHSPTSAWILALTLGERVGIPQDHWEVLRNTGTNHLMAIAGLHIGFLAGFSFTLFSWLWKRFPQLLLLLPSQHAGGICALFIALFYSALAGFSLPTQRACIMLSAFFICFLLRRNYLSWQCYFIALLTVLILNPLNTLDDSFWLSFGSVALIIFGMSGRLAACGWWWKWGRIQWVIAVGLIPLSVCLFQELSIISFFANSIAIPCVGFLILPTCFIGVIVILFLQHYGGLLLTLADKMLAILWKLLSFLSTVKFATWHHNVNDPLLILLAFIACVLLLAPRGFPGKYFGWVLCLPAVFFQPPKILNGDMTVHLLDVGQGLATVVQTANHLLIFDTGAKFGDAFDMGESVVVPFIHSLNKHKIDIMVISHPDNDHMGGAASILKKLQVLAIKTSVPDQFHFENVNYCLAGDHWIWDDVDFKFLYPTVSTLGLDNDSSCVLKVTSHQRSVLMTGDIEKFSEKYLLKTQSHFLQSTVMIAPHHGSKTSGLYKFIEAVHPKVVLYPIGYRNRYHFPHAKVMKTYNQLGIKQLDTVNEGQIEIQFLPKDLIIHSYRKEHLKFWHNVK